jgi:pimeloyl-ACP methyl ester carboxylesterase
MDQPNHLRTREGAWLGWRESVQHNMPQRRGATASGLLKPGLIAAGAAATGLAAVLNYRRGRAAERAHPPVGQFLEVDGVKIHYIERGEGPPVVLLHGNGAMAEDFAVSGLLDRLAENHRVIAFDRPGYGYTERPRRRLWTAATQVGLLRRAVQQLGVHQPVVIGHSWGATVAVTWALGHERELAGLVLMSGYYYPTARRDVPVMSAPAIPVIGDLMRYTVSPPLARLMLPKLLRKIFAPLPVPRRFALDFPLELTLRPWQLRASAEETAFMIPWAANHQELYRYLSLPVTIVAGDADKMVTTTRQSMRLHEDMPHSDLRVLPGLGHMIHYFAGDEIAASVEAVLGRAGARDGSDASSRPQAHVEASHGAEPAVTSPAAY